MTTYPPLPRLNARLAALAAAAISLALSSPAARAQTTVTLDGTSGSNSISTAYTLSGDTTFDLGFFADYLIVAGGGSGGGRTGGGGGAGEFIYAQNQRLTATSNAVTVGAGGAQTGTSSVHGNRGGNSSFLGLTANGGGAGAGASTTNP